MTRKLDSDISRGDLERSRAYLREFGPAVLAYCLVLSLVITYGGLHGDRPTRYVWALVPMLPAMAAVWAVWRHLQRLDEYQRNLVLQGLALGFGAMVMAALTFGFLALAGLTVPATPWLIYTLGMVGFGISMAVRSRQRY